MALVSNLEPEFRTALPAELKTKWIIALRSGDYEQGRDGHLRDRLNCFCCLGVLADVCGVEWQQQRPNESEYHFTSQGHDEFGLFWPTPSGVAETTREQATVEDLILMNDQAGASFAEIADWIEENVNVTVAA